MRWVVLLPLLFGLLRGFDACAAIDSDCSSAEYLDGIGDRTRLRSAYLVRGNRSGPSAAVTRWQRDMSLRRHFQIVLRWLADRSPKSIETALDRLERQRRETWSKDDRERYRRQLWTNRIINLARLHQYQLLGRFPQNRRKETTPIFVDQDNTACAVGFLMRQSGWQVEVHDIALRHNDVYIADVTAGPLIEWIQTSGLTQEEAALIQPSYDPPPFDASLADLLAGEEFARDGLIFENFSFSVSGAGDVVPTPENLGIAYYRWPVSYFGENTDGIWLGAERLNGMARTEVGQSIDLRIGYDVSTSDHQTFDQFALGSTSRGTRWGYNGTIMDGAHIQLEASIFSSGELLGTVRTRYPTESGFNRWLTKPFLFDPVDQLRVETRLLIDGGARMTSFAYEFGVEPNYACDLTADGVCNVADIEFLTSAISARESMAADLNRDGWLDDRDRTYWVKDLMETSFGDANLDRQFDEHDLVEVFVAGQFEDDVENNSSWATGDWDGDREFTSEDIVLSFVDGGYTVTSPVPEPSVLGLAAIGAVLVACRCARPRHA